MKNNLFISSVIILIALLNSCTYNTNTKFDTLKSLHSNFTNKEKEPVIKEQNEDTITFVATGHLYPLLKFPEVYKSLILTIEEQNPDYVFLLGDLVFNDTQSEWDTVLKAFEPFRDKLYFSPGNHDLNYHYERYAGKKDHQFEAEKRYLDNIGYRYKLIMDKSANYLLLNMNDSLTRIEKYLSFIRPKINMENPTFILTSQSLWHATHQDPNNVKTWPLKPFTREEILPEVEFADYLIHGDWNNKFFRGKWKKQNGKFEVMAVGNKRAGDAFIITRFDILKDTVITTPIFIPIPENSKWNK